MMCGKRHKLDLVELIWVWGTVMLSTKTFFQQMFTINFTGSKLRACERVLFIRQITKYETN